LCKHSGVQTIIGTCGSANKLELIKQMGVTHAINYVDQSYIDEIRRVYPGSGDGVDVVLNSLGGDTIKNDISILRTGGRVVGFGGAGLFDRPWYSVISNVISMLTLNSIDLLMASTGMQPWKMETLINNRTITDCVCCCCCCCCWRARRLLWR
jgi:NADPH:quinone reductase-like Zn-dependent oxidoreductase